jgi:hypothetical protein
MHGLLRGEAGGIAGASDRALAMPTNYIIDNITIFYGKQLFPPAGGGRWRTIFRPGPDTWHIC